MTTLTSVMSVTVSPWIPAATREAARDRTLVHDAATSCVSCARVCVYQNRGKHRWREQALFFHTGSSISSPRACDSASVCFCVFIQKVSN